MSKQRFTHLSVAGFRRLRSIELDLKPLTVLVGANGVGKTSLLDVMSLLAASAEGRLMAMISEFSGIGSLLTCDGEDQIDFKLSMEDGGNPSPLQYALSLKPSGHAYAISEETLAQQRDAKKSHPFSYIDSHLNDIKYFDVSSSSLIRPNWIHNPLESSLAQVPKMFNAPELFRHTVASSTLYHALNVSQRAPVRLPQPMRPTDLPGKDGEDLVACLYNMRETNPDSFNSVEDTLRAAFPSFERLNFPPVAAGTIALTWKDTNFTRPIYTHQLSEGTLRFLWLVTLLHSPALPAVTMIDEPEVSLHPEMLRLLVSLFREASERTQLIVATHSDRMVRFLVPDELSVMDQDEMGGATIKSASTLDLDRWMKDYALDELWRMGRLGGRA